jgi:16S rRNA (cytidine1402-2'-O)-methyltransferase
MFEAPGRAGATLADLVAACGPERPGAVCRELTKLHEQIVRGSLAELAREIASGGIPARGEFVLVVGAWSAAPPASAADPDAARAEMDRLVAAGASPSDAARQVAAATGLSRRDLYRARIRDAQHR